MFLKLHYEGHRIGEECEPYDCFNFFVTAWHLYDDWLLKDMNRPKLALEKKGRTTGSMLKLLLAFKNLTDGSKHMVLDKGKYEKKVIESVRPPRIGDWLSYFTNTPRIYIKIENSVYSMWDVRYLTTHYFSWLFNDSVPPTIFPQEIERHLNRCVIKTRK